MFYSQILNFIYCIAVITFCHCSLSHFHISTRNCLFLLVLNPNRSFRPSDSCHILTLISVSFFFAGPEPFIRLRFQYPLYFRCTYTDIYICTRIFLQVPNARDRTKHFHCLLLGFFIPVLSVAGHSLYRK